MRKLLTLALLFSLGACQTNSRTMTELPEKTEFITPSGKIIKTTLAISLKDQEQGLSGVRPEDFDEDQGMLFYYLEEDEKHFWMPDTYFDLDIIYLDKNFKVVDIIRKLPHYKGRANPNLIPRARPVWSRHALEMKADSKISKELKEGDQLKWTLEITPQELDDKIRQKL